MASDSQEAAGRPARTSGHGSTTGRGAAEGQVAPSQEGDIEDEEEDTEEEEDDEPKLKYVRLTSHLLSVYRNGDATSAFLVAGDKMFIGTHSGNVHVISLPSFQSLRAYRAHTASITSISISPFQIPSFTARPDGVARVMSEAQGPPKKAGSAVSGSSTPPKPARQAQTVPRIPSNDIYIATSSIDGNVCVQSLIDVKDVQLRNFARPVQSVALSPDYKNDRTYISGGLAGNVVLTVGGRAGTTSTSSTTGSASAAASGWLGTIGLGGNTGKDTVLHSGEGTISTVKWSLSGKYVVWVNEYGIKIMRSNLHLETADAESAWKRLAHIDRPRDGDWDEMAGVWKARAEWVDEKSLESDDAKPVAGTLIRSDTTRSKLTTTRSKRVEKLVVGWGGTMWMINVHPGETLTGRHAGERTVGRPEISKMLRMDCIISGLSLYTPTLLLVLAYITPDEDEEVVAPSPKKGHKSKASTASTGSEPSGGIRRRQNALSPELRLIDLATSEEVETDGLEVSRFERLSATDYHLGVLPAPQISTAQPTPKGTLETLSGMGSTVWNATISATALVSSSASVRSGGSGDSGARNSSTNSAARNIPRSQAAHPYLNAPSMKIFLHSPYDCIVATKRDLSDHLTFVLEKDQYEKAWHLIDDHPEVIASSPERLAEIGPGIVDRPQGANDDFYDDTNSVADSASHAINSSVEKEKRRIGELWIQQRIQATQWQEAGTVCGKVLGTSSRWEHWVWVFAGAKKFDDIVYHIPTAHLQPPLPSTVYEVMLGHYISQDRSRLPELLDRWPAELFDVKTITDELENQLKYRDVREDSVEDGIRGRDWRLVMESLGRLYVADGRRRDALKCYIRLQDADAAMALIKDHHLVDAVSDDIPSFILLRVSKEQEKSASRDELETITSEAITLLVQEAQQGLLRPDIVVSQLQEKDMILYLFFYLRSLWKSDGSDQQDSNRQRTIEENKALVDEFADLAVKLFASYDRPLLIDFLKKSTSYNFEEACKVCEERDYVPELVHLYSRTGQTRKALFLIIDRLGDVSQAISFAKQQGDSDLWDQLLDYSMDKPRFIRGLLEEVGTAIDPITLVRRIPEGLEIEGLREGLSRMIKEYELQYSISEGVARVMRGEVGAAQTTLRAGQRKGVRFDIVHKGGDHVDIASADVPTKTNIEPKAAQPGKAKARQQQHKPGHCVACTEPFSDVEMETLVGFACGHVFHLSHLLEYMHPERPPTPPDVEVNEDGEWTQVRSVGAKVTHARLLRDKIQGGCPVCSAT